mmetsp:Transcript_52341/g.106716  ORF Transcript_52341/g.106716 Transcript_52341/m.106716 type:complete len:400 (+) Transcript_52341:144-1343(+)|eukprot:CAMPEP_0181315334 /NCGR_PEP_ID=MMETSP1101-20121128/15319_1 /TAXON_ID=46948 /ORGANISM="Rhodomonas abbreviata, Strain Caron Lab Isolate" /LENGTH=399 /DNA_ID=CAMNT_0023422533 /DNA_START=142 /DNA_END=1341 /DNA_ORIENTATION=+
MTACASEVTNHRMRASAVAQTLLHHSIECLDNVDLIIAVKKISDSGFVDLNSLREEVGCSIEEFGDWLLRLGCKIAGLDLDQISNPTTNLALHVRRSIVSDNWNAVRMLYYLGARDPDSHLVRAACDGQSEIVRALLDSGANPSHWGKPARSLEIEVGKCEMTPLIAAAWRGHKTTVDILINARANLDLFDVTMKTALYRAAQNRHTDVFRKLVQAGADLTVRHNGKAQWPLLSIAILKGDQHVAGTIIEAKADLEAQDKQGRTALHEAVKADSLALIQTLIAAGASLSARSFESCPGWTPLHEATRINSTRSIRALLEAGAAIDVGDMLGMTPLHLAAEHGHEQAAALLVERGASLGILNREGRTALEIASSSTRMDSERARGKAEVARRLARGGRAG